MKILAILPAALFAAAPAIAGPYANIESNTSFYGNDYKLSVLEAHGGYTGEVGEDGTWYLQAGPALVSPDGEQEQVEFSGKAGATYQVSEDVNLYGEYAFLTGTEFGSSVKAGVTYKF
jgi:outer membrane autotransporter protein